MATKKKILPINELKPGMISYNDIYFEGKILVGKGVPITEPIIQKLKKNYVIDKVEVYSNNENKILKNKTIKELETIANEFSSNLEHIFNNLSALKIQGMDEIRNFSKRVQGEFEAAGTDTVIKDVAFYGSGNDTIYRHSVNVAAMSFILGKWLNLNEKELNLMTYSAVLHDFGKTKIDKDILKKEGSMNSEQYEIFKKHTVFGYNLIKEIPYLDPSIGYTALMHHERADGSGYPLHLKADKIHKFAKIIAVADVFDEVSSNRYPQKIRGPFEVLKIIQENSITKLDYDYCTVFLKHILDYYMGENVQLNDKRLCKVVHVEMDDLENPLLLAGDTFIDLKKEKNLYIEKLIIE